MICPSRITIRNSKTHAQVDNASDLFDQVPCGKCGACIENKKNEWVFRLEQEMHHARSAHFITLTYNDANLPYAENNAETLNRDHPYRFIEALKKRRERLIKTWLREKTFKTNPYIDRPLKFYGVGEYGSDYQRPHYHILIFNTPIELIRNIHEIWQKGRTHFGAVELASIRYVAGYIQYGDKEKSKELGRLPEFNFMSRKPAIGHEFLKKKTSTYKTSKTTLPLHQAIRLTCLDTIRTESSKTIKKNS